jgi:hypothetical protein
MQIAEKFLRMYSLAESGNTQSYGVRLIAYKSHIYPTRLTAPSPYQGEGWGTHRLPVGIRGRVFFYKWLSGLDIRLRNRIFFENCIS